MTLMTAEIHPKPPQVASPSLIDSPSETQVRMFSGFEELSAAYPGAFEETESLDFHASLPWFHNFVGSALDPGDRVRLYGVESREATARPLALLPMKHRAAHSLLQPRMLFSLTNYYTCLFEPLLSKGSDMKLCVRQITSAIKNEKPQWDVIRVVPMASESPFLLELRDALNAAGFVTQEFFSFGNWYFPVEGRSYAEYISGRPSVLQNTLRRKAKKLEQTGRARVEVITAETDIERAIKDYSTVYNASWKIPEPYPNFVPGLIRTCVRQNWLRLGLVYLDDAPIAAQLWIVREGVAYIYKLAYKEEFASLSAGTILTARLMQHVLDVDHVREIDYLSGDDDYKKAWMSHRRERWGLLAFNQRTLKGTFGMARHIGGRKLKRAYQRIMRPSAPAPGGSIHS